MSQFKTNRFVALLALFLTSCATLNNSQKSTYFDSAFDDKNRAPAAFSPPKTISDGQKIDPFFIQSQADYNYSLAEAFSLEGAHQKAVEHFKATLVYDPNASTVKLRLATEYLKSGQISESLELTQAVVEADPENENARMLLAGLFSSMRLYPKALEQYSYVLKKNPENTEAALYTGAIYAETQKYEQSIKYFESLLKKVDDEQKHTIHYYLARVYLEFKAKNSNQLVEFHLRKSLENKPNFAEALLTLANHLAAQNQNAKAAQLLEDYQKKQGPSVKVAEVLTQMYLEKEDYDSAYEQLEILEAQGDDPLNTKLKMALILVEKKLYQPAMAKLKDILREVPESDRARFYLAALYEQSKDFSKAVTEYKKIPSDSSYYNDSILHAVYIYKADKDFSSAELMAKEALSKKGDEPTFYSLYASVLNDNKKSKEASVILEDAISKFPQNTQIHFFLGTVYDSMGKKDKVVQTMESIIEKDEGHVQALNYVAYTLAEENKDLEKAENYARKAVSLDPKDGYVLDTLGWVLYKQGKINDAIKYLEAAHKLAPQVPIIAEHLGDVYVKQAMVEKARQMYKRALEIETEQVKVDSIQNKISALDANPNRYPASNPSNP